MTNLIYEFTCNIGDCALLPNTYIGMTQTSLARRLTMHLASGGPKSHLDIAHGTKLTREILVNKTKIIYTNNDPFRLQIMEALLIKQKQAIY